MTKTTYVLKSAHGTPVFSFDDEYRARKEIEVRKASKINLRLFEIQTIEREIVL